MSVRDYTTDVGVAGSYAKVLTYYAAKSGNATAKTAAKGLLDGIWRTTRTPRASRSPETKADYNRLDDPVYVPPGWTGKMPNGDSINSSSTFMSIRSFYKNDPDWPKVDVVPEGHRPGADLQLPPFLGAGRRGRRPGRVRPALPLRSRTRPAPSLEEPGTAGPSRSRDEARPPEDLGARRHP